MAYNTQNYMVIKQEMVSQLGKDIFTFHIAIQHVLKKNNFVVLTFWSIVEYSPAHFY